jgi:FMN hydrolase / 5-amino-6-(5-phospho-D-ribitylamino)uracil phosphatase
MPATVKAITLDLDDTLWPIDRVIDRAEAALHTWLEQNAPGVAQSLPPPSFAAYRRLLALELPAIAHDYTALRMEALRRALREHGVDPILAEPAMEVFLGARNQVEFFPDVLEALDRLCRRYRVVSLSNGNADLERIGIHRFFAGIMNARIAGFPKPDARIFHAACARIAVPPESVLHVGDDPDLDVRGALGAGVRSAWINRRGNPWPGEAADTVEFRDLLALCDWLGV